MDWTCSSSGGDHDCVACANTGDRLRVYGKLVRDKRLPAICCDANGSHIAGCGAHSGRVGVLARAVDSHP